MKAADPAGGKVPVTGPHTTGPERAAYGFDIQSIMSAIGSNLQAVRRRIDLATTAAGRAPDSVRLVAVSKTFPPAAVDAAIEAGQRDFGENYVQEAIAKITASRRSADVRWHMIGPIQSNKTRLIAEHFDWVHSVDRLRIAQRLSEQRPPERGPLRILLQVNIDDESSKSGIAPAEVLDLARAVAALPRLHLVGLMAIPRPETDPMRQRAAFRALATLGARVRTTIPEAADCEELSMGMSGDFEAAIAEGATLVRIGTAIFGSRPVPVPDLDGVSHA